MKNSYLPQSLDIHKVHDQKLLPGLYIVSTPIGNIFDITIRAISVLHRSKYIFAEDTRVAKKLASFYNIKTEIISCNDYTELKSQVLDKFSDDCVISLISDAGTPLISDPGYKLVNWCLKSNIDVYPIPGVSSPICGLSVSGLPTDEFHFVGFLPSKHSSRCQKLKDLLHIESSIILFESPNRIVDCLQDILDIFGNRQIYVGRELTKMFEEHLRGKVADLLEHFRQNSPIGEFVIIVGKTENVAKKEVNLEELLYESMKIMSIKDAVSSVKDLTKLPRSEIYQLALKVKNEHRD